MACKHPLVRYEYANGDYKVLSYEFIQKNRIDITYLTNKYGQIPIKETQIPCQHCIACRLNHSASWANRLVLELKNIPDEKKWFVTLTYDDTHLHKTQGINPESGEIYESNRLEKKDMQDFFKRLRKKYAKKFPHDKIRCFYAGEYGETTNRAHYHAIIWNLKLDETRLKKYKMNKCHQQLYICEELQNIWQNGYVVVGKVSWESIAYTARYIMKKQKGTDADTYYKLRGQIPEFCHMSTKPGIAKDYYEAHKDDIYKDDQIAILRNNGAFKIKPPKYFDALYDIENHEVMEAIKEHRQEVAKEIRKTKLAKTTLTELELLAVEERTIQEKVKKLARTEI